MVHKVRENCGRVLAEESPVDADIVSVVPESAIPSAHGYSKALGIEYTEVISGIIMMFYTETLLTFIGFKLP